MQPNILQHSRMLRLVFVSLRYIAYDVCRELGHVWGDGWRDKGVKVGTVSSLPLCLFCYRWLLLLMCLFFQNDVFPFYS